MATEFWVNIDGSLHNIGDIIETEQIKYYRMGVESLAGEIEKLRQQLAIVGGELAVKTQECNQLHHKLGAWADVVGSYIAARDCQLLVQSDNKLKEMREMVAKAANNGND